MVVSMSAVLPLPARGSFCSERLPLVEWKIVAHIQRVKVGKRRPENDSVEVAVSQYNSFISTFTCLPPTPSIESSSIPLAMQSLVTL
jgi:hypothetical protein